MLSRASLSAPWSVGSVGSEGAIFHAVLTGTAWVHRHGDAAPRQLHEGEIVVLPGGDAHAMSSAPHLPPTPLREIPRTTGDGGVVHFSFGGGGAPTRIICGSFRLQHLAADGLLGLLPRTLTVDRDNPHARWIDLTLAMIEQELAAVSAGADAAITRLTDVLFVHLLRSHVSDLPPGTRGLLGALSDAQIARSVGLMRGSPAERWTVGSLARAVGLSRSTFAARFTALVGEPPMQHLTRWRMLCAADTFSHHSQLSTIEVAAQVGYLSEDAFVRAFRRVHGCTPALWRRPADDLNGDAQSRSSARSG